MNSSSNASTTLAPKVQWAQRRDKLFLTVCLDNITDQSIDVKDSSISYKCKGGPRSIDYEFFIEFHKEVDTEKVKHLLSGRECTIQIHKKEEEGFWPRLTKDSKKLHFLKTDFSRWKDEDDTDDEEGGGEDFNLDDMMQSMGGLQGAGGPQGLGGEEEEDSDDEDLPDLQN